MVKAIRSKAVDPLFPDNIRPSHLSTPSELTKLSCMLCKQVFDKPVDLECGVTLCADCLIHWVECDGSLGCPNCELDIDEAHLRATSTCVHDLLKGLLITCPLGCKMIVRAGDFNDHMKSKCKDHRHYQSSASSPSRVTAKEMMARTVDIPMTPSEKSLAGSFIKRMMAESPEGILRVPTRGQVRYNMSYKAIIITSSLP